MSTGQITASVTAEEHAFYREAAKRAGFSMASLVKVALAAYAGTPAGVQRSGLRNYEGYRRAGPEDENRTDAILAMVAEGLTLEEIGGRFGVSRQRVYQIVSASPLALSPRRMGVIRRKIDERVFAYTRPDRMADRAVRRFWNKVDKSAGPDACWLWTGSHGVGGSYGVVVATYITGKKNDTAHRVAFYLANAILPGGREDGQMVCHKCNNPICCNPDHLYLGNGKTNASDRDKKLKR